MTNSLHTVQLQEWARRIRDGDRSAPDELLRAAGTRLEALARKMLRKHPAVRRHEETGDVLQNALVRLLRALAEVEPTSVRDFFGLAAEQMRRELLDLARHHYGPHGRGANEAGSPGIEPADDAEGSEDLERWTTFHESVAALPAEEREVVGLVFYHGWQQAEVAELFGVTVRTIQRHWQSALGKLQRGWKESSSGR
jgi:RNA polymerase sigma-70 factor (ECF subfamily)